MLLARRDGKRLSLTNATAGLEARQHVQQAGLDELIVLCKQVDGALRAGEASEGRGGGSGGERRLRWMEGRLSWKEKTERASSVDPFF